MTKPTLVAQLKGQARVHKEQGNNALGHLFFSAGKRIADLEKTNKLFLRTIENLGYPADLLINDLKNLRLKE